MLTIKVIKKKPPIKGLTEDLDDKISQLFDFCMDSKQINKLLAPPDGRERLQTLITFIHQCAWLCHEKATLEKYSNRARTILAILLKKPLSSINEKPTVLLNKKFAKLMPEINKHFELMNALKSSLPPTTLPAEPDGSPTATLGTAPTELGEISESKRKKSQALLKKVEDAHYRMMAAADDLDAVFDYIKHHMNFHEYVSEHIPALVEKPSFDSLCFLQTLTNQALGAICSKAISQQRTRLLQKAMLHNTSLTAEYLLNPCNKDPDMVDLLQDHLSNAVNLFQLKGLDQDLLAQQNQVFNSLASIPECREPASLLCSLYQNRQNSPNDKPVLSPEKQLAYAEKTRTDRTLFSEILKKCHDSIGSSSAEPSESSNKPDIKIVYANSVIDIQQIVGDVLQNSSNQPTPSAKTPPPVSAEIQTKAKQLFSLPTPTPPQRVSKKKKPGAVRDLPAAREPDIIAAPASSDSGEPSAELPLINPPISIAARDSEPAAPPEQPVSTAALPVNHECIITCSSSTLYDNDKQAEPAILSMDAFSTELSLRVSALNRRARMLFQYQTTLKALEQAEQANFEFQSIALEMDGPDSEIRAASLDCSARLSDYRSQKANPLYFNLLKNLDDEYNRFYDWLTGHINVAVPSIDLAMPDIISHQWINFYQQTYSGKLLKHTLGITPEKPARFVPVPGYLLQKWPACEGVYLYGSVMQGLLSHYALTSAPEFQFIHLSSVGVERFCFTINAIFCDKTGRIIDPTSLGYSDYRHKTLRTIGDPEHQFAECPSFIIQALEYISVGFSPMKALHIALLTWKLESLEVAIKLKNTIQYIQLKLSNPYDFNCLLDDYGILQKINRMLMSNRLLAAPGKLGLFAGHKMDYLDLDVTHNPYFQ